MLDKQAAKADPHAMAIARAAQDAVTPEATVILFGSRATGRHRPNSDVDLMVLTDARDPHIAASEAGRAACKYMEQNPPWLAVNPVGLSWRDFHRYSRAGLHAAGQAARFGVCMNREGLKPSGPDDGGSDAEYPAHWPATSQRIRNVLRHQRDMTIISENREISRELFGRVVQQAVENALKGWLSAHNVQRDFGHNLLQLWDSIREVEADADDSASQVLAETGALFDYIGYQLDNRPADWLTRYAVLYQYLEVGFEIDRVQVEELAQRANVVLDAIVAHVFALSGVAPDNPQALAH